MQTAQSDYFSAYRQLTLTRDAKGVLVVESTGPAQQAGIQGGSRPVNVGGEQFPAGGDVIVAIGELGAFWAGALTVRAGRRLDERDALLHNALVPVPKVKVALDLRRRGLLRCAIDILVNHRARC